MIPLHAVQSSIYSSEKSQTEDQKPYLYHHAFAINIKGNLDEVVLNEAFKQLIARHAILHSPIILNNEKPYLYAQPIEEGISYLNKMDVSESKVLVNDLIPGISTASKNLLHTLKLIHQDDLIFSPFNLEKAPLWRHALLKYAENNYQLIFVFHQLIFDNESQQIFLKDLSEIYNALIENRQPNLLPIPNLSIILADERIPHSTENLQFWQEKLQDPNSLQLQTDYPPLKNFRHRGDQVVFQLEDELIKKLKKLSQENQTNLETILLTSVFTLLYRYTSESDITINFTTSTRETFNVSAQQVINCFNNSFPLRILLDKHAVFTKLLTQVDHLKNEAFLKQIPIDELKELINKNVPEPSINISFNFNQEKIPLSLLKTEPAYPETLTLECTNYENFGIRFEKDPHGNYFASVEFNTDLFNSKTIQSFINHLKTLLHSISLNPNASIASARIISTEEAAIFSRYYENDKPTDYSNFVTKEFKAVAKSFPDRQAIVFHEEDGHVISLTYRKLDKITDDLAAFLNNINIGPEKTIGVCLTRSPNLIVAILAILKAGGVVVTMENNIENSYSADSPLYHKISDTIVTTVIVDNNTKALFPGISSKLFCLNIEDESYKHTIKELGLKYQEPKLTPNNLAYIMYTSGTTGKPKGVMIEHGNLTNLMYAIKDRNLPVGSKVLCTAPPTFDCFIWEMLEAIVTKGECHLINEKQRLSAVTQQKIIQDFGINCATLLPDTIKHLNPQTLPSLIDVISMGGIPHKDTIELWQRHHKSIRNEYGPTETTICITENICLPSVPHTVVGKPIRNNMIYILDENYNICPPNIPGEIYIGGAGVARGYVDHAITQEKFPRLIFHPDKHLFTQPIIPSEHNEAHTSQEISNNGKRKRSQDQLTVPAKKQKIIDQGNIMRLYATGDLAKYYLLPDNTPVIYFIGRKDRQIKIHGVRIEIDGITALLRRHPDIKDVYVKANDSKDALIAYVVTPSGKPLNKMDIDHFLQKTSLQRVAWPKSIISLNELPINKNGKINVKALPNPNDISIEHHGLHTDLEIKLCQIWADVLRISNNEIDVMKTFREHGGDSLALSEMELILNQEIKLAKRISINVLDKDMTITSLAGLIESLSSQPIPESNVFTSAISFFGASTSTSLAFQPTIPKFETQKNRL